MDLHDRNYLTRSELVILLTACPDLQIQQLDPVYVDFTESVTEMNKLRRAFQNGDLDRIASASARVRFVLDDGTIYPIPGKLLFSEARVDAQPGQVTLRGEFANPAVGSVPDRKTTQALQ